MKTAKRKASPTRRYEIRWTCEPADRPLCRTCRPSGSGYHLDSCSGSLDRARRAVLYLQRDGRDAHVVDTLPGAGSRVPFRGYTGRVWRSTDGSHRLEAWGDVSYVAKSALEPARGTFSLLIRDAQWAKRCRLVAAELPIDWLWIIRDAAETLVPDEDAAAFARWAVRRLRAAHEENPESIVLLRSGICPIADWPGAVPIEELLKRPAA